MAPPTGTTVYIKDDKLYWIPAVVTGSDKKGTVNCRLLHDTKEDKQQERASNTETATTTTSTRTVQLSHYRGFELPIANQAVVPDLQHLQFLHEPGVYANLHARYAATTNTRQQQQQSKPYTRSGDFIIAVNPFERLDDVLYTPQLQHEYAERLVWVNTTSRSRSGVDPRDDDDDLEPHIYEVSALAYKGLLIGDYYYDNECSKSSASNHQSIVVTGESGSGKTESAKLLLHHLAVIAPQQQQSAISCQNKNSTVVQRILDANPILEAFGNAATVRNSNSSRFGKYTELQFTKTTSSSNRFVGGAARSSKLVGSVSSVYLLETARVTRQANDNSNSNERTYHIFYQLLAANDEQKQRIWSDGLRQRTAADFKYLGDTNIREIEGVSDAHHFQQVWKALQTVGLSNESVDTLFRAVCIVLQLGNLTFQGDHDHATIKNDDEFRLLMDLTGISQNDWTTAFTQRTMTANGETFKVPLSAAAAKEACDAFAKEIYSKTFLWLVRAINSKTVAAAATSDQNNNKSATDNKEYNIIGLLDIFGFESFDNNRFGQLCINYANEKLQQKASNDIFLATKQEYELEGIPLDHVEFKDNEQVLNVIEGRLGLISLLNEECYRPKGNDVAFVQKTLEKFKDSPYIVSVKGRKAEFAIVHYAGKVVYQVDNFVHSNQDTLPVDLKACAKKCSNDIVANHLGDEDESTASTKTDTGQQSTNVKVHSRDGDDTAVSQNTQGSTSPVPLAVTGIGNSPELKRQNAMLAAPSSQVGKRSGFEKSPHVPTGSSNSVKRSPWLSTKEKSPFSIASGQSENPWKKKNRQITGGFKVSQSFDGSTKMQPQSQQHRKSKLPPDRTQSAPIRSIVPPPKRSNSNDLMAATVWTKYQEQLGDLLEKLSTTKSRYVRCIKPNDARQPRVMDQRKVMDQLRCAGIVATVKLSRAIYPSSIQNAVLRYRFQNLWDKTKFNPKTKRMDKPSVRCRKECEALLSCALASWKSGGGTTNTRRSDQQIYAVGKTKSYFASGVLEYLEAQRLLKLDAVVTVIQRLARGVITRNITRPYCQKIRASVVVIQSWYRKIQTIRREKIQAAAFVVQSWYRGTRAHRQVHIRRAAFVIQSWYREKVALQRQQNVRHVADERTYKSECKTASSSTELAVEHDESTSTVVHISKPNVVVFPGHETFRVDAGYTRHAVTIQRWYRTKRLRSRFLKARRVFERNPTRFVFDFQGVSK